MRHRSWWTVAVAAVVVAAAVSLGLVLDRNPPHPAQAQAPPPTAPSAAATTPPATSPSPTPAPPRLDAVAPARPVAFTMRGPQFTIKADVCAMPFVRPLDPPGEQHHTVCWVDSALGDDFGVAPGYPSRGTSYLLGHAWAEDPLEVLNPMSELAMRQVRLDRPSHAHGVPIYPVTDLDGYTITLRTATGRLVYEVTRAFAVAKDRAADVASVMATDVPGRVVLITCGVRDGRDVDVNVIAYAKLVRSVAIAPTAG